MATDTGTQVDSQKLEALVLQIVGDMGGSMSTQLGVIGDKLGLYRAIRDGGSSTPAQIADATGTRERYVREWLNGQAAAGGGLHQRR
jgi:hypothetical protein